MGADLRPLLVNPTTRGVHHLALCTDDMKATILCRRVGHAAPPRNEGVAWSRHQSRQSIV
jgi:hypothetical protein